MKRILHVCNNDFYLHNFLIAVIDRMIKEGYEVHVACKINGKISSKLNQAVIIHDITYPLSFVDIITLIKSVVNMNKIISFNHYDCVINHNRIASFVGRISAFMCKIKNNIYFAHGFYFHDDQNYLSKFLCVQLERCLSLITSFTLSQSKDDLDLMICNGYIDKNKTAYVANGIDNEKFRSSKNRLNLRNILQLPKSDYIICSVGRLVKGKGFQDLIEAFRMINKNKSNTHLLIIGGNVKQDISKFQKQILDLIKLYNIENNVTLTGMVDNVEDYLECSDLYVSPSYREGLSRSLLEAMSMGLPVIATEIRGSKEVINHMQNGVLYKAKYINELIKKIDIVSKNEKLQKELSQNAIKTVESFYTEKKYTDRQMNVINKIISNS